MTLQTNEPTGQEPVALTAQHSALGLATLKNDSPARFVVKLVENPDTSYQVLLKYIPIGELDDDGFGLYGTLRDAAWKVQSGKDSGKVVTGDLVLNERGEAYTQTPYNDRKDCVYRSIANSANRAATLAVDPGMTARAAHALQVATVTAERDAEAHAKRLAEITGIVIAAAYSGQLIKPITRADVDSVRSHELCASLSAAQWKKVENLVK